MDQRGKKRSGTSPGGRDARTRRSARSERVRHGERSQRAPEGKPTPEVSERDRPARVVHRRRSAEPKVERTILGLSTSRAVILAVVVCALALTLAVPLRTYFTQRTEAAQIEAERTRLEHDLDELRTKRAQQDDPAYIAAEARDRLRLVMPGDTPYQVQLPGAYEAEQAKRAKPKPAAGPWYKNLFEQISKPQQTASPATPPPPAPGPVR
ncbi:FtsB family cell division protein [Antrihabitans stalactiti]|uniref:Septum formation initiator family protein n=1 Tax=Antrihabitans stalactiti TaxID=2584121 RepID=A0A848KKA1_9NOCA|nr:septum formation initiator family protein [Antrihabitans stalactiti]NMN96680.1 septum formation initiator family protein [Antrihabitans stalactiti]